MIEPEAELNVQKDIEYINNELISITHDETYIKFSRPLNAVSVVGEPKSQFERYWFSKYTKRQIEQKQIMETLENLFENKLTPPEEMIAMIEKSDDVESEKIKAISLLRPKRIEKVKNENSGETPEKARAIFDF